MNPGDPSTPMPPVIPDGSREASGFLERGSATRSNPPLQWTLKSPQPVRYSKVAAGCRPALRWWALGFFLAMGAAGVFYRFNPSQYSFYPRCFFNAVTGLLCPGCGSQRALYQLVHGHVLVAMRCNLLFMLVLPWVVVKAARQIVADLRGTPAPRWLPHPRWYLWIVAGLILFAVLRNVPGAPFCYLAPP